jgi:hypothetical protein
MANVLNEEKKQQVLALGRPLRQIQKATRIRRETASQYRKAAGITVRPPGGWGRRAAKAANEVITDFGAGKPAIAAIADRNYNPKTNPENQNPPAKGKATSKPANEVITDSAVITDRNPSQPDEGGAVCSQQVASPQRGPSASACEAYRETVELGLSRGRNAMAIGQDLVDEYSFASSSQSVQRFVRKLRGTQTPEARVVIVTAPGQEAQVDYGTGLWCGIAKPGSFVSFRRGCTTRRNQWGFRSFAPRSRSSSRAARSAGSAASSSVCRSSSVR